MFAFRHRAGTINWNAVSAVDVKNVVEDVKVGDLQEILDNITFCEFGVDDVKSSSVDTIAKLVQVFQFIVEYLLHCQESQCVIIQRVHKRNEVLLDSNNKLKEQNAGLKEDKKIYQRQLAVLRRSIGILQPQPPRLVLDATNRPSKDESSLTPIIKTLLDHEKETRETLKEILEEQKNAFMKGLELQQAHQTITTTMKDSATTPASKPKKMDMTSDVDKDKDDTSSFSRDDEKENAPTIDKEVVKSFSKLLNEIIQQQRLSGPGPGNDILNTTAASAASSAQLEAARDKQKDESARLEKLKAQLEVQKRQLTRKERDIHMKEENLMLEISDWERKKKAEEDKRRAKVYLSSVDSLSSLRPPQSHSHSHSQQQSKEKAIAETRVKLRGMAAMALKQRVVHALMSQVANAFRIWVHFTMETRDRSQVAEHARLLKSAAQMHQKREEDLKSQLDSERERAIAEQSRLNDIILTTQQERDRLQSMLNIANARLQHLESDPKLQSRVTASVATSVDTPWRSGFDGRNAVASSSTEYLPQVSTPLGRPRVSISLPGTEPPVERITVSTSTTSLTPLASYASAPEPQTLQNTREMSSYNAVSSTIDPSILALVQRKLGNAMSDSDALDLFDARINSRRQLRSSREGGTGLETEMNSLAAEIARRLQLQKQQLEEQDTQVGK